MKRMIFFIGIVTMLTSLWGCKDNAIELSLEQSKKNIGEYTSSVESIVNKYGYQLEEDNDEDTDVSELYAEDYSEDLFGKLYIVEINDSTSIEISLHHSFGREGFHVRYISNISNMENRNKNINVPLFVELVNAVSGKQITEEYCYEFLNASEEEYPAKDDGYNKDYVLVEKAKGDEDWGIYYTLENDYEERLGMRGLTKQLRD